MKKFSILLLAVLFIISCKKEKADTAVRIKSQSGSIGLIDYTYNSNLQLEKISEKDFLNYTYNHVFTYQNGRIASFDLNTFGLIFPNYLYSRDYYFQYSYPDQNTVSIKKTSGTSKANLDPYSWRIVLSNTNGLLTKVELYAINGNQPEILGNRIEISYEGKNPSSFVHYKRSYNTGEMVKSEVYDNMKYDTFLNPYYTVFNGLPNFYIAGVAQIRDIDFINLNSISANNPLAMDVKYYDTNTGKFLGKGKITYDRIYDGNKMISYSWLEEKLDPFNYSLKRTTSLNY